MKSNFLMKKRTAFVGAVLSLMNIGEPFLIKTIFSFSTSAIIISHSKKVNAESAEFYINRGSDKLNVEDYEGAISDYTEAIKINPEDGDAYYNRGIAKENLEDWKGAISDYTEAIKINPEDGDAYERRYEVKILLGDYKGGVTDKNKALKIFSEEIKLSIEDILSPQILEGKEIKYKAYKKFGQFKNETYTKPITYYIQDKTSGNTLEISDDEEKFIVDFFNYIDLYIDLDFEREVSKGKAIIRIYKSIPEDKDAIDGTGYMDEPETLNQQFYLDLSWSESKLLYPKLKNYPTLSMDDAYTIAHEIGHALGLEHKDEGSKGISDSNIDPNDLRINSKDTVMSYNVYLYPGTLDSFYTELDIKALIKIWGVEKDN